TPIRPAAPTAPPTAPEPRRCNRTAAGLGIALQVFPIPRPIFLPASSRALALTFTSGVRGTLLRRSVLGSGMHDYDAYGLHIRSSLPLLGLLPSASPGREPDVSVRYGELTPPRPEEMETFFFSRADADGLYYFVR